VQNHHLHSCEQLKAKTTTTTIKITTRNYSCFNGQNFYTFLLTQEVPDTARNDEILRFPEILQSDHWLNVPMFRREKMPPTSKVKQYTGGVFKNTVLRRKISNLLGTGKKITK
jgi:hypothetical protein